MDTQPEKFQVVDVLQESERFLVQSVAYDGITAVLKRAKTPEMTLNLQQELEAYQVYGLMTEDKDCPFSTASVLESHTDWMLISFLEGRPMRELMDGQNDKIYYDKLASIMAFCDNKVGISFNDVRMSIPKQALDGQQVRIAEMIGRHSLLDAFGLEFLKPNLKQASDFYVVNSPQLKTCFVNADLTPAHVMVNGESLAIFDFENAEMLAPRFADVINVATKIWFIEGDGDKALDFVDTFWNLSGQSGEAHALQIKTLIYRRCIGFTDELLTDPNQHHNTSFTMTPEFAHNISAVLEWANEL
ncbi:MAG: hypothetical protein JWM81_464 [Candidatus Saccharibacteria bacterium]|nr:hypothetical protein [Candidatus Saccharibacteria bacterium]